MHEANGSRFKFWILLFKNFCLKQFFAIKIFPDSIEEPPPFPRFGRVTNVSAVGALLPDLLHSRLQVVVSLSVVPNLTVGNLFTAAILVAGVNPAFEAFTFVKYLNHK